MYRGAGKVVFLVTASPKQKNSNAMLASKAYVPCGWPFFSSLSLACVITFGLTSRTAIILGGMALGLTSWNPGLGMAVGLANWSLCCAGMIAVGVISWMALGVASWSIRSGAKCTFSNGLWYVGKKIVFGLTSLAAACGRADGIADNPVCWYDRVVGECLFCTVGCSLWFALFPMNSKRRVLRLLMILVASTVALNPGVYNNDINRHFEGQHYRQNFDWAFSNVGERWKSGYLRELTLNGSQGIRCSFFFCVDQKRTITVNLEPGSNVPWGGQSSLSRDSVSKTKKQ